MRFVYIALIVAFTALVLAFKIQNLESATVSFFGASATLPTSALMLLVYVLGMLTGGMIVNLVKGWVRGATQH